MRKICCVVVAGIVSLVTAGCAGCPCGATPSMGWSFQVGRPSTLNSTTQTVLAQNTGPVGVQPLGALTGVSGEVMHGTINGNPNAPTFMLAPPARVADCATNPPPMLKADRPPCNLDEICRKLDLLLDKWVNKPQP